MLCRWRSFTLSYRFSDCGDISTKMHQKNFLIFVRPALVKRLWMPRVVSVFTIYICQMFQTLQQLSY